MTEFRWTVTFVEFKRTTGVAVWINICHIISVVYTKGTNTSKIVTVDGVTNTVTGDAMATILQAQEDLTSR